MIDNKVRKRVWEIAQSMIIMNKQGTSAEHWNHLIDYCVTQISDLVCKRPLSQRYMADKTSLNGQNLMAAMDQFVEVGLRRRKNRIKETMTEKRKLVYVGMYFITPVLLLFILMICRYRRHRGRNLRSKVFAI